MSTVLGVSLESMASVPAEPAMSALVRNSIPRGPQLPCTWLSAPFAWVSTTWAVTASGATASATRRLRTA